MIAEPTQPTGSRRCPWWIVLGALLLPCLYLPTLGIPFDFADDALLVYAPPPMPLGDRLAYAWSKVIDDFQTRGPFRPAAWAYWEGFGELLGPDSCRWRFVRILWATLASAALLWFLKEAGFRPVPSLLTATVLMWNPFGNELWLGTTMPEGIAMPFALSTLACALCATRSRRPWLWDILGAGAMIAALGCKNTFAALIPAQFLLRIAPEGRDWRAGWRLHGRTACLLSLTILLPVAHFIAFKANPQPGQYTTTAPKLDCLIQMLKAVGGTMALDYIGLGLLVSIVVIGIRPLRGCWNGHRGVLVAGLALFVCGIGIYLPIGNVAPRYAIPAAWGAGIWLAALMSLLDQAPRDWGRQLSLIAIAGGLLAAAGANIGRQDKTAARIELLWEALACVKEQAPAHACIGWWTGPGLELSEGYHFRGHLQQAGRRDICMPLESDPACMTSAVLAVSGGATAPGDDWRPLAAYSTTYWFGRRQYQCFVWRRNPPPAIPDISHQSAAR